MRKSALVVCFVLAVGAVMAAQNKIETKWHCPKATSEQKLDVGDMPDHSYMIAQGSCSATASSKDFEEKSGVWTEMRDVRKSGSNIHGTFIVTMADGDKVNYSYAIQAPAKKPPTNKWTLSNGTGKLKGVKGSGNCSGKMNDDGSSDWECTGTYTIASK